VQPRELPSADTVIDGRSLVTTALYLYVLQGLNFLIPLLSLAYLVRVLGPQTYGLIAFAQAFIAYAVVVTDYGFPLTAARDVSVSRDDSNAVGKIFWTTLTTKLLLLICCVIVLSLIIAFVPDFRKDWRIFAACSMVLLGNAAFPIWYLQGIERLPQAALVQLVSRSALTAGVLIFVRSRSDSLLAALLISAPLLVSGVSTLLVQKAVYPRKFYRPKLLDIRSCLARGWHVFAGSVSTTLYLQTNAFILGIMADKRAVAYFSVGYSIVLAVQGFSIPATQSVFPRVSLLFSKNPALAWSLARNLAWAVLPAMAAASVLMAIFAKPLIQFTAGVQYLDAVSIVRVMAALPLMISAAAILGPCVMINVNLSRHLMWIYLSVGALNVALLPHLILSYGAAGAAIALVIAETFGPIAMMGVLWTNRGRLPGCLAEAQR
jgi:polysaccharide transporter, PST family